MAENILNLSPILIALLGGVIPSLVWLWFWLKEDKESPEPDGLIALSFFAGMAIVFFVLPLQKLVVHGMSQIMFIVDSFSIKFSLIAPDAQTVKIALWAFIEEFAKYATVFLIAFKSKFFDEPMDAVIYLITATLGFSAMENTLYILKDFASGGVFELLVNGNMRFVGATVVHIVSSAFVGIAIAFAFYTSKYIKYIAVTIGILVASLLHTYFNLSIIESNGTVGMLLAFSKFWGAIIVIIVMLAIIKHIPRPNN